MALESHRNVKWIDGLRGLASLMVVLTHLTRAFDTQLFSPRTTADATPLFLQLPIIRIPTQGRIGVCIFSFLTGYVCALKPIRQARAGNHAAALSTVAKSAIRRTPRLVLPTTIVTIIAWFLTQLGAYKVAKGSDSGFLWFSSPLPSPTYVEAVWGLIRNIIGTWTIGQNDYDHHHWSLFPLLKGSMMVYVALAATVYLKAHVRMIVSFGSYVYFYRVGDATFGMQCFFGMFIADLSNHPPAQDYISSRRWTRTLASPALMLVGLYLCSYPGENPEWAGWSRPMLTWSTYIFPAESDVYRFYSGLGLNFITVAIYLSPTVKDILASKYLLWLGKNSFAVYLLHGTLLRTVLAWMFYGITAPPYVEVLNDEGKLVPPPGLPLKSRWIRAVCLPIWFGILYLSAHLWTTYVDSLCARWTQRFEQWAFQEDERDEKGGDPLSA
ncbi:MAG: hypothetical protein M1833_005354 [Piccolia ochrophora]|nr:MAG: hypothetical protein M1833_005354 [Piccolia ochrophora]